MRGTGLRSHPPGRRGEGRRPSLARGEVPLERALSKLGLASRTEARSWILAGEVTVDGVVRTDPDFPVVPERVHLARRGGALEGAVGRAVAFHKPRGVVTTRSDPEGRPTIYSLLPVEAKGLQAVGRLDLATSGLLLLTNDTRLADWLLDPANAVPRTYLVTVKGRCGEAEVARLEAGVRDGDQLLRPDQVLLRKASGRESHWVVTLCEGKNREVRRLFATLGHPVTRLRRVSFGGLALGELAPGAVRELGAEELRRAFPGAPGFQRPAVPPPS